MPEVGPGRCRHPRSLDLGMSLAPIPICSAAVQHHVLVPLSCSWRTEPSLSREVIPVVFDTASGITGSSLNSAIDIA